MKLTNIKSKKIEFPHVEEEIARLHVRRESAVEELEEAIADSMTEHYAQKNLKHRVLTTVFQFVVFCTAIAFLYIALRKMFPNYSETLREWADWANDAGTYGVFVFSMLSSVLILIPGLPGTLLCLTCGAVFPFWRGLFIAVVGQHIGACISFLMARKIFFRQFTKLISQRPSLQAFSVAARVEQWKVTFLSRFVLMPVQLKNYGFGVLPVTFTCFFFMTFLGDLQSVVFTVYIGSLSHNIIGTNDGGASSKERLIGVVGMAIAIIMTSFASIVARRAYQQVLSNMENENGDVFRKPGVPSDVLNENEAFLPKL